MKPSQSLKLDKQKQKTKLESSLISITSLLYLHSKIKHHSLLPSLSTFPCFSLKPLHSQWSSIVTNFAQLLVTWCVKNCKQSLMYKHSLSEPTDTPSDNACVSDLDKDTDTDRHTPARTHTLKLSGLPFPLSKSRDISQTN